MFVCVLLFFINFPSTEVLYNNVMRDTVICDLLGLHLEQ